MAGSEPIPDASLLAQMAWVRGLARRIVLDPDLADEVAQETWLCARERPPRLLEREQSLRAWLARVTRTIALRVLRRERGTGERERAVAPSRSVPTPLELVERTALQRKLAEIVLELEEPLRSAVLLRYAEGLDARAIARIQGTSEANARQRVSRGIARLRQRLAREQADGRLEWRALVALARSAARGTWGTTVQGLLMHTLGKLAAALLLLSLGWWAWRGHGPSQPTEAVLPAVALLPEPEAQPAGEGFSSAPARAERSALAPQSLAARSTSEAAEEYLVRARILDATGAPLAGATLGLAARPDAARARADADGRVALRSLGPLRSEASADALSWTEEEGAEPGLALVVASAVGHTSLLRSIAIDEHEHDLGELRLFPAGAIGGLVVDGLGRPVAGASVRLAAPTVLGQAGPWQELSGPDYPARSADTESDAEGRFLFREVREGLWRVWAGGEAWLWSGSAVFRLERERPAPEIRVVLRELPPENTLVGRVLCPDGRPSHGTRVEALREREGTILCLRGSLTDERGRFRITVPAGFEYDLTANGRGWSRLPERAFRPTTLRDVRPGAAELVLVLGERRTVDVLVSDREGLPLPDFALIARGEQRTTSSWRDYEDTGGRVEYELPEQAFVLVVRAKGYADRELGPFDPARLEGELPVVLERLARLHGRVLAEGRPLAGALVELARLSDGHEVLVMDGFPSRWDQRVYERTTSDAQGRYELAISERASFALRVEHAGYAASELEPLLLDPTRSLELDLELDSGGVLEGRVLVPRGQDPGGAVVRLARGDSRVHEAVADAAGAYRIEHLTPGPYMVELTYERVQRVGGGMQEVQTILSEQAYEFPWRVHVLPGQVTHYDVDLATHERGRLHGWLLVDGRPHAAAVVRLVPSDKAWNAADEAGIEETSLGRQGDFRFGALRPGPYRLVLAASAAPLEDTWIVRELELEPGEQELRIELESAALRGRAPAAVGELLLRTVQGPELYTLTRLGAGGGHLRAASLPAGEEVALVEWGEAPDPLRWKALLTFTLPAHEWTELE